MINENEIIESGLLELYALGITDSRETELVERMVSLYPAVRSELEMVNDALLTEAIDQPVTPSPLVKPFLLATLNYNERLNNGYSPIYIPELTQDSKKEDFEQWVEVSYEGREEIYAHIFNLSPEAMSALIWLKSAVPEEIHHEQLESFFIFSS